MWVNIFIFNYIFGFSKLPQTIIFQVDISYLVTIESWLDLIYCFKFYSNQEWKVTERPTETLFRFINSGQSDYDEK